MKQFYSIISILFITITLNIAGFSQDGTAGEEVSDGGAKIMRIGVLMPKVKLTDAQGEVSPAEALRNSYAVLLSSDLFEIVALDSKLTSLALAEAKKKNVDFILKVALEQIQKKKGGGLFGKIVRDTGNRATYETSRRVGYGGNAGTRVAKTTARSVIRNTGYNMSKMAVKIKKNDKFTLNYNLTNASGKLLHTKELKAKAKKNNDDVLTVLLEQSGEDIVKVLMKQMDQ